MFLWESSKKNFFFEKKKIFCWILFKTRKSFLVRKDFSKFWWLPWFAAHEVFGQHLCTALYVGIYYVPDCTKICAKLSWIFAPLTTTKVLPMFGDFVLPYWLPFPWWIIPGRNFLTFSWVVQITGLLDKQKLCNFFSSYEM